MHTDEQIAAAARFAQERDPADAVMQETTDLLEIVAAVDAVRAGEVRVVELVAAARANDRSWGEIGIALGVSRQAARERFMDKVKT